MSRTVQDKRRFCTTCGTVANPIYISHGSLFVGVVLVFFFILPGVFYLAWCRSKEHWACAKCKGVNIIPLDSPIAIRTLTATVPAATVNV